MRIVVSIRLGADLGLMFSCDTALTGSRVVRDGIGNHFNGISLSPDRTTESLFADILHLVAKMIFLT